MTRRSAIPLPSALRQNPFPEQGKKKRAGPLDPPSGTTQALAIQTATTPSLALPWTGTGFVGLSDGAANFVMATHLCVGDVLHR